MTITSTAKTAMSLKNQRETWEHNALKTSNSELYQLLGDCLDFFHDLVGNPELIKELNAHLDAQNLTFNKGTHLATKVVRAVFDEQKDKRTFTYARAIMVAAKEKSGGVSMHDFIVECGGIEKMRRGKSTNSKATELRNKRRKKTAKYLSKSKAIAKSIDLGHAKRKRKKGGKNKFLVAIMREETNGKYSIVFETDKGSVVNTALTSAGDALDALSTGKTLAIVKKPSTPSVANGSIPKNGNVNSAKNVLCLPAPVATKQTVGSASATQTPEDLVA